MRRGHYSPECPQVPKMPPYPSTLICRSCSPEGECLFLLPGPWTGGGSRAEEEDVYVLDLLLLVASAAFTCGALGLPLSLWFPSLLS